MSNKINKDSIASIVDELVDFIKPTYGPASGKVIIANEGRHKVLDDGFAIANKYETDNEISNAVIQVIREVSSSTNQRVGDGTTGSLIILQSLINQDLNDKEILNAKDEVIKYLRKNAKILKTEEELKNVAKMAFNNEEIAQEIAKIVYKLGAEGIITIEEGNEFKTTSEIVEGMRFDRGFISPYFVNNHEKGEAVFENAPILVSSDKITSLNDILPLLENLVKKGSKDLVMIVDDINEEALSTLIINKMKGSFNSLVVRAPSFGERKREFLEDIAVMTGATLISQEKGMGFSKVVDTTLLGSAKKIVSNKDETIIIGGKGNKKEIENRVNIIKNQIKSAKSDFDKEEYEKRLGRMTKGIGVIKVGGLTEAEIKSVKYKIEDALNATKIAFKGGVVKGGGLTLSQIETSSKALNSALKRPVEVLVENNTEFDDVNDPVEVLVASIESAVSIALLLNSVKGVIVTKPKQHGL